MCFYMFLKPLGARTQPRSSVRWCPHGHAGHGSGSGGVHSCTIQCSFFSMMSSFQSSMSDMVFSDTAGAASRFKYVGMTHRTQLSTKLT